MSKRYKKRDRNRRPEEWAYEQKSVFKPARLPLGEHTRLVQVFVEGYEDVAFWRGILDDFESEHLQFEISVPPREDLAKGKKVILQMVSQSGPDQLLCVDSDFDYLFDNQRLDQRLL